MTAVLKVKAPNQATKDSEMIALAQANPRNFKGLYEKYYEPVFYFIYKRVDGEDLAHDLCSDVFLKALSSIKKYQDRGFPFASWLYRIASNTLTDFFRKNSKYRTVSIEESGILQLKVELSKEEIDLEEKGVLKALDGLKPDEMELINLRYFEDRSFKEIAAIREIELNNAQVKVHRIIKKLRKEINNG